MEIFFVILKKDEVKELERIFQTFGQIQKTQWMVIPFIQETTIKSVFIVLIKIQINKSGLQKLQKSQEIRKLIFWLSNIDQKMYYLENEFHKIGINPDQYSQWQSQSSDKDVINIFEEDLNIEEKANKWFFLIMFLQNISIDDKIMISYLKKINYLIENSKNQIFIKLDKSQCLKDIELKNNDSIFIKYQKLNFLKMILYNKNEESKNLKFAFILKNFNKGFNFINQEKMLNLQIIKYFFIKQCVKQDNSFFFQISELQQGVQILEVLVNDNIWQMPNFNTGILKPYNILLNNLEQKYQNLFQQYDLISITNLVDILSQKFIFLIQKSQEQNQQNISLILMIRYINYMLKFNHKLKYQKLINEYIALIKEKKIQINLKKLLYALELQHLSQMKNYNKIKSLKNRMEAIDGIKCDFLLDEISQYQTKQDYLEKIDNNLIILQDFKAVGFYYKEQQLYLQIQLQLKSKQKILVLQNLQLILKSDNDSINKLSTEIITQTDIGKKYSPFIQTQLQFSNLIKLQNSQYLYLDQIKFEINGIKYILTDISSLKSQYIDLNKINIFKLQKSGFITKFDSNSIFFEETAANYYFIQFSLFKYNIETFKKIKIEIQKSSKFLLMEPQIYLISNDKCIESQMIDWEVSLDDLKRGQYILILKIYILENKHKNYKLKLNIFHESKQYQTYLTLKDNQQKLEYLKTKFIKIKENSYQLSLQNYFQNKDIFIQQISYDKFKEPICLKEKEEYSQIINQDNLQYIDLVYQINCKDQFLIEKEIQELDNKEQFLKIDQNGQIRTKIFHVESLMINHEVIIKMLKIKNSEDLKLYQQNVFILKFLYNKKLSSEKNLNLEIKYPKDKYIVIGTTRYELIQKDEEQELQIQFLPIDSGYMQFPKLMLVEMRSDGSEHQHLLNDILSNKRFFINENLIKATIFNYKQQNKIID